MKYPIKPLALSLTLALANSAFFTYANEDNSGEVEKIIVYGALNETPLSQMAASISVLASEQIERRQAQHLDELFALSPNVNFATGASRGRFVQIRGIGERSQFVDPVNPSVGYLVDGIDYSGLMAGASTFDVQQIEIFKGPNSARFGAEGLAGMVNVLTSEADAANQIQAGFANYGSWHLGAALGGELSNSLSARLSAHTNQSNGFIENTHLNRDDTNNIDELTIRVKADWQASDDLALQGVYHRIDVDNGYDAFSLDQNRTTLSDKPGFDRQDSHALALKADYQGLDWANLQAKATYLKADLDYGYDEDWSYVGIRPGWEYSSTDHYLRDRDNNSIELKLTEKQQGKWVVGFYYADEKEELTRQYTYLSSDFFSVNDRTDMALYAQYQADLSEQSWLTLSGRLARQELDYSDTNGTKVNTSDTDWGAELSYHYQVNNQTMLYTSLTRSFKMGGVNGSALGKLNDAKLAPFKNLILANKSFGPESLLGTEFGLKGTSEDGDLQVDLAVFYQWRDDVQFNSYIVQEQKFTSLYNNAVDGTNYGLELSLEYWLNEQVSVFANLGWLGSQLNDFTRVENGKVVTVAERDQAHAPNYQSNIGVRWQISERLRWTLEADSKDTFYYSYSHDNQSDKYTLVNTAIQWSAEQWQLSLYARNLFDKDYANRGFYFGNDPRDEYAAKVYQQFGEPRRFGVSVSYEF